MEEKKCHVEGIELDRQDLLGVGQKLTSIHELQRWEEQ